jgi:RNA polymerase sigma-70 factor (ECF subfamily)
LATSELIVRARAGEEKAREQLFQIILPRLHAWVHGRIPSPARSAIDTDDLVQISLVQALKHLDGFVPRHEGAFMAYLRQIAMNRIRDELRRHKRTPEREELDPHTPGRLPSPIEELAGRETLESYESALAALTEAQREAVILRVEFNYAYDEIAAAMERASVAAARMLVIRGLSRLSEVMNGQRRKR